MAFPRHSVKTGVDRTRALRSGSGQSSIPGQPAGIHDIQLHAGLPQFRTGMVHFFVSSQVARQSALVSAMALGKTARPLFRLSMALVVYMTFRAVWENLNMGLMQSQLSLQRVMQPGYFCSQAARTSSRRVHAVCSSGGAADRLQIVGEGLFVLARRVFQRIAHRMHDAPLVFCQRIRR